MRFPLNIILVLITAAGLHARTIGAPPCEGTPPGHCHEHSENHGHPCGGDPPTGPCDSQDKGKCPAKDHHHHHHGCHCPLSQLIDARDTVIRLGIPHATLLRHCGSREIAPESPVLSEDKPPLI